jgi:hypothetical protein
MEVESNNNPCMQLENCSFGGDEAAMALPGSLRFLSLKCERAPSDAALHLLLHQCTGIEELYMTAFATSNDKPPDLGALLPIAGSLRSLVLDLPGVPVNITEVSVLAVFLHFLAHAISALTCGCMSNRMCRTSTRRPPSSARSTSWSSPTCATTSTSCPASMRCFCQLPV